MKQILTLTLTVFPLLVLAAGGSTGCNKFPDPRDVEFQTGSTDGTDNLPNVPQLQRAETLDLDINGKLDHLRLTFNHPVNDSTFPGYADAGEKGLVTDEWAVSGYSNVQLDLGVAEDVANDEVIYLSVTEGSPDTGLTPEITTTEALGLQTVDDQAVAAVSSGDVVTEDKAPPRLIAASGRYATTGLRLRFSEPVSSSVDSQASLTAAAITYNDDGNNAGSVAALSDADGSDGYIAGTLNSPAGQADFSADSLQANPAEVYDLAGNAADNSSVPLSSDDQLSLDGTVYALIGVGNTLYVGGSFSKVGTYSDSILLLDPYSERLAPEYRYTGGTGLPLPDGRGGWYTLSAGDQHRFDGNEETETAYSGVINLNSDGSLGPWQAPLTFIYNGSAGVFNTMVATENYILIGGAFDTYDGKTANGLAAIDKRTGNAVDWGPLQSFYVMSLAVGDGVIYAGGGFYEGGSFSQPGVHTFDLETGRYLERLAATDAAGYVWALELHDGVLYIGGEFTQVDGQNRSRLAALEINATGAVLGSLDISVNNDVRELMVYDNTLYARGDFTSFGGQTRNRLAAVDLDTQTVTAFDPAPDAGVNDITVHRGKIVAGGSFTAIGGAAAGYAAYLDTNTGALSSPDISVDNSVTSVSASGANLLLGGSFNYFRIKKRENLLSIDLTTNEVTAWNPAISAGSSDYIKTMVLNGDNSLLYIGGLFSSILGQSRTNLAAVVTADGSLDSWAPSVDSSVLALAHDSTNSLLYVGGNFNNLGGQARYRLGAVDDTTGLASAWNPDVTYSNDATSIDSIDLSGSTVYIAGTFTNISATARKNVGAIDAGTAAVTSWDANADSFVNFVKVAGSTIYVGGSFSNIGGGAYPKLARINAADGLAQNWNAVLSGTSTGLVIDGSDLYAFGGYFEVQGTQTYDLIRLDEATAALDTSWVPPQMNGNYYAVEVLPDRIIAAGNFDMVAGSRNFSDLVFIDKSTGQVLEY